MTPIQKSRRLKKNLTERVLLYQFMEHGFCGIFLLDKRSRFLYNESESREETRRIGNGEGNGFAHE
jgi:hypothetical protein